MVTREQVLEALREVEDPEVHRSIVELEMVKEIQVEGSHVFVEVLLTIKGCPLHTSIERSVRQKVLEVDGVETVEVKIGHMSDEQRAKFAARLRGRSEVQGPPPILDPAKRIPFIAVASGKGGVGKSTVTANLAAAMGRLGLKVGVIDADIYGFSIPGIFGVKDKQPTVIDNVIIPIEIGNVKLISTHFFVPGNQPVVWRGPMIGKMFKNFFSEVHWGDVDVVLLDLPPGTGDIALDVHQLLPKCKELIVTTPQMDAAEVAVRAGVMGLRTNHEIIGVVENMSYFECECCGQRSYLFGQGGGDKVAEELGTEVLSRVPIHSLEKGSSALFVEGTLQAEVYHLLAQQVMDVAQLTVSA